MSYRGFFVSNRKCVKLVSIGVYKGRIRAQGYANLHVHAPVMNAEVYSIGLRRLRYKLGKCVVRRRGLGSNCCEQENSIKFDR